MDSAKLLDHFKNHPHWFAVKECVEVLTKGGFKAYLAGGCVRDAMIGRPINDFDLATDALPEQMQKIFKKSLGHAAHFGVISIPYNDQDGVSFQIEITRFRWDKVYEDGRRPKEIEFSSEKEDAKRRDFSMNSLFFDLVANTVIDFTGGQQDIDLKLIKAVGQPLQRFQEDRLRILRAIRFQSQIGFDIEPRTLLAIQQECKHIQMISKERVFTEVKKTIEGENYLDAFNNMYSSGIFSALFNNMLFSRHPYWEEFKIDYSHIQEKSVESFFALMTIYELKDLDLAFRSEKLKELVSFYKSLKVPSKIIKSVQGLITIYFDFGLHNLIPSIRVFESKHNSLFFNLLNVLGKKDEFIKIREIYKNNLDAYSHLKMPLINGRDCLALEIEPFDIGEVLDQAYEKQLLGLIVDRNESLAFVRKLKESLDRAKPTPSEVEN